MDKCFGLLNDRGECLAPVADFNDAHARLVEIDDIEGCLFEHLFGQDGRAGVKIIDLFWHLRLRLEKSVHPAAGSLHRARCPHTWPD